MQKYFYSIDPRTPLFLSHPTLNIEGQNETATDTQIDSKLDHPKLQFNLVQNTQILQYMIENAATIFRFEPPFSGNLDGVEKYRSINCDTSEAALKQIPLSKR